MHCQCYRLQYKLSQVKIVDRTMLPRQFDTSNRPMGRPVSINSDFEQKTIKTEQGPHHPLNFFLNDRIGLTPPTQSFHRQTFQEEPQKHHHVVMNSTGKNESQRVVAEKKPVQIKRVEHFSYATSDEIGIGFSSRVYKGKNDQTNQLVAIKVVDVKGVGDQLHQEFLNQEVKILQKIKEQKHNNLLRLQGVFKSKNNIYIVSEFCEGKDMGKVIRKKKKITEQEAQSVMKQLLMGFGELYRLNIVHRDLKLANILVKQGTVKIADFGFAIGAQKCEQKFTYNVGSPYYMPPQSLKLNLYSSKSDVWALGVIAYELVHGKTPWKDKNDKVLYEKMNTVPIEQLIEPQLNLSANYRNFILKCLTLDYERRASPNTIINWQWDMAKPLVEGIEEKKFPLGRGMQHPHNMNENYPFGEISSETDLFRKRETIINHQVQMDEHKTTFIKSMIEAQNKHKKTQGSPYQVQQTLLAQLHYCRFLSNLYEQMHRDNTLMNPPSLIKYHSQMKGVRELPNLDQVLESLKLSIAERIIYKIQVLGEAVRTNQNLLNIQGFEEFIKTPAWEKLKGVISQHQGKYYQTFKAKTNSFSKSSIPLQVTEQQLAQTIKRLKQSLNSNSKNLRLLELLVFYYQILGLQKKNNPGSFSQVAKMDLLASKKLHQNVAVERLVKKLEYMRL